MIKYSVKSLINMSKIKILFLMSLVLFFAFSKPAYYAYQPIREFEIKIHNINQVEMSISNFGKFGQTEATNAGCWWPRGSGENYIYGAGPWFGTIDSLTSDTLVTIGYGPYGAESEYTPGLAGMSMSDPDAIIFMSVQSSTFLNTSILNPSSIPSL